MSTNLPTSLVTPPSAVIISPPGPFNLAHRFRREQLRAASTRQKLMVVVLEAWDDGLEDEKVTAWAMLLILRRQIARLPDTPLNNPAHPLPSFNIRPDGEALNLTARMDEDIAAPTTDPGSQVVEYGRRKAAEGWIEVWSTMAADEGECLGGEGRCRVRARNEGGG
ncbi:hypothetical protein XA68_11182 [Ophiocordyceps unilateralis]|uniref:Uncharacterized protein n=1 Tax=Ophiocordyceps unilateralis TaxID=268505 RepID=A0A2A9PFY1_OPHUN|nr:hypothetical protein XA68_11182 [Ophiocordyceps unilateralis]